MPTKDDLTKLLVQQLEIEARCNVYYDIAMLIQKYEKKITRQHNDAKRKYARIKSSVSDKASYKAFEDEKILNFQIIETLKLGKEFLERAHEVFNESKNLKEKIHEISAQLVEDENKNTDDV